MSSSDDVAGRASTSGPWRIPWWLGDLIAALFVVAFAFAPFSAEFQPGSVFAHVVVLLPVVVLPFRRRWPLSVLAVCLVLDGVAAFTGILSPGIVFAVALALFGVSVRRNRRTEVIAAAVSIVTVIGFALLSTVTSATDPRTVQFAFMLAFAAAIGDATRSRHEYVEAIMERAERAEATRESEALRRVAEERLRIARDLHDTVAHQISVISLNAGVASATLTSNPDAATGALATIRTAARTVLSEISDLLEVLRADDGTPTGTATPQPGLDRRGELLERFQDAGLDVSLRIEGDLGTLPIAADLVAYRVIQEALTNAHKHGVEHRAHVLLAVDAEQMRIIVTNPIAPDVAPDTGRGHGLLGLRERVASVRGTVAFGASGGLYRLEASLPLHPGAGS